MGETGDRLRIVVLGYVVRGPLGGLSWHHLQYVMGLDRLGHDVTFVEDSEDYPACYDPSRHVVDTDPSYGLDYAARVFDRAGLGDRWAYHDAHAATWRGPLAASARNRCERADLLLNVSGVNPLRPWLRAVPTRVLIDTDPVFTQIRHRTDADAMERARGHNAFFTFGENIPGAGSGVPDDGLPWRPTRQPVVLDAWPVTPGPRGAPFTTVMQWDSYKPLEYGGRRYGMKSESFEPYLELPQRSGRALELALGSESAPRARLEGHGWRLEDPLGRTADPWAYQDYLRRSRAEFGVAKHGYVLARSGWFSERSTSYLASGRPVLVQDTGFSSWLPTGRGVLAFSTPDEALAGIEEIDRDYERHCRAAREVVEEHFDSTRVLRRLIGTAHDDAGV